MGGVAACGAIRRAPGPPHRSASESLNVCLPGVDSTALLQRVSDDLAASNGAACHWGVTEPSVVLTAMGVPPEVALGAMRLSLGQATTEAEVDRAVAILARELVQLPTLRERGRHVGKALALLQLGGPSLRLQPLRSRRRRSQACR